LNANAASRSAPIIAAAATATLTAGLGALVTDLGPWYAALSKPAWQPPDWLFGPVWTLIFGLTAIAAVKVWRRARPGSERTVVATAFALNAVLNILWSVLFFRLHQPAWAQVEVIALWASICALIVLSKRRSPLAAWLLVPYLLWVSFAAVLNMAVADLNPPNVY
jgi:translocator protein